MKTTLVLGIAMGLMATLLPAERLANGLEFRKPDGWSVKVNPQAAVLLPPDLVMETGGQDPSELYLIAMLPGIKDLQDPQLASILRGQYFPAEAQVRSAGAPQPFRSAMGTGYLHRLDAVSQGVALHIHIYVAGMPGGGVAGVMAIGRPAVLARREAVIAAVAASLSSPPVAAPVPAGGSLAASWEHRLSGRKLYQFSAYSSSYGSGGSNSQKTLLLRANGTYEFHRSASVSVYVPGASGGSASQSGDQGQWRIAERGGKAVLELISSKGTTETITLTLDGGKTLLNGQRWLVGD